MSIHYVNSDVDMIRFNHMQDNSYGIIPFVLKQNEPLFLLILHQKGHWAFPKGHKEGAESDIEAAVRELREETGLTPSNLISEQPFFEHYTFSDPDKGLIEKTVTFYLAKVDTMDIQLQPAEVADYGWFTAAEAMDKMTFPAGKQVLELACAYLEKNHQSI